MSREPVGPWRLLLWSLRDQRNRWGVLFTLAVGVAGCELAVPFFLQEAVDAALDLRGARLDTLGLSMLGVIVLLYVLHALMLRVEAHILYRGTFRLRRHLYLRILHQPLAFFTRRKLGEIQHRVMNEPDAFEDHGVHLFSDLPFDLLTVAGVLAIMAFTDLRLTAVAAGFLVTASIISAYVGRSLPDLQKKVQGSKALLNTRLHEGLAGIRAVKTFGREPYEVARLDESSREIVALETRGGGVESYLVPIFDLMELLGVVLVVWYGAHLIVQKEITPGNLVAFLFYMEILAGPVSHIEKYYRHLQKFRAVAGRIGAFLAELSPVQAAAAVSVALHRPRALPIVLRDVCFTYPGNDRPTLQGLNFSIGANEVVAVVGKNGSGKSTLMDLLLQFHEPTGGRIVAGGTDLRAWDMNAWRQAVGYMSQDVFLIHASVAENVAYARPEASRAEIEAVVTQAGLQDLVRRLPQGLDTVVGDRGSRLSGGERQRIALARLFLRDPQLLILDESTAHLDAEASLEVNRVIARLALGRTVLLISHRPETLALADRVLLIDAGRVIADGSPEHVARSQPLFRSLTRSHGGAAAESGGKTAERA